MALSSAIDTANERWLTVKDLASLAGIIERNARDACKRCDNGGTWHGCALEVRRANGKSYQVNAASLPPDLLKAWQDRQAKPPAVKSSELPALLPAPAANEAQSRFPTPPRTDWIEEAQWKESLILPALAHPPRSHVRGNVIKEIATREHVGTDGQRHRFSEVTVRKWISLYENHGGWAALVRLHRREPEQRFLLSRKWDAACPLSDTEKAAIKAKNDKNIKNLWGGLNPGWQKVDDLNAPNLMKLCREAGWQDATLEICRLGRHAVERFKHLGLIHTKRKDAKRFSDQHKPRITRDHTRLLPMEIVVGDVHPVDIHLVRADGSIATPRLIAWYDLGTHRLFATPVLLDPGQGITQADVWASFAAMVRAWGLPEHLYLDNGLEYNGKRRFSRETLSGLMKGFNELSGLAVAWRQFNAALADQTDCGTNLFRAQCIDGMTASAIIRAIPYNAAAKPIEGAFSALEKLFKMLNGYIGGDRMNKRTPALGKQTPAMGTAEDFEKVYATVQAYWNVYQRQSGNLDGQTPEQVFSAHVEQGWKGIGVARETLIFAMSEELVRKVDNDGIEVMGARFDGDPLVLRRQEKVTIRYAKWAPECLIFLPNAPSPDGMVMIERAIAYHPADPAGAKQQKRQESILKRHINDMAAEILPVDAVAEMQKAIASVPAALETPIGPTLSLGVHVDSLVEEGKRKGPPKSGDDNTSDMDEADEELASQTPRLLDAPIHTRPARQGKPGILDMGISGPSFKRKPNKPDLLANLGNRFPPGKKQGAG